MVFKRYSLQCQTLMPNIHDAKVYFSKNKQKSIQLLIRTRRKFRTNYYCTWRYKKTISHLNPWLKKKSQLMLKLKTKKSNIITKTARVFWSDYNNNNQSSTMTILYKLNKVNNDNCTKFITLKKIKKPTVVKWNTWNKSDIQIHVECTEKFNANSKVEKNPNMGNRNGVKDLKTRQTFNVFISGKSSRIPVLIK